MQHQIQRRSRLDARAVLPLWLQQGDLIDVLPRNPVGIREAKDGVGLGNVEPVERQIEADDRLLGQPFDQPQRFADRPPPYLVKPDRAVFLGVLQQHHHAVQPAGFAVDVDLAHAVNTV